MAHRFSNFRWFRFRHPYREITGIEVANLSLYSQKTLQIVYDNLCSPPTYGDFIQVLMLARYLALTGRSIHFLIVDDGRRVDWELLEMSAQDQLVGDQLELARSILSVDGRARVEVTAISPVEWSDIGHSQILFREKVVRREDIYQYTVKVLSDLIQTDGHGIPEGFLLGTHASEKLPSNVTDQLPYIAWHVRRGLWGQHYDSDSRMIRSDFDALEKLFPKHNIMLICTPEAGNLVESILGADFSRVTIQPDSGFRGAIPWIIGSSLYYQRLGGGINQIAIFSKVPYDIIMDNPSNYYHLSLHGKRLVPWAGANQHYRVVRSSRKASHVKIERVLRRHIK